MLAVSCSASSRCRAFRRSLELVLSTAGAAVVVAVSATFWLNEATSGGITWPLPALVLLQLGIFGPVGLAAVFLDRTEHSRDWGLLTWAVTGMLSAVMLIGAFSIGPLVFPAVMAFGIAGILADRRRERTVRAHVALAALCAVGNLLLLVALAVLSNLSR